MQNYLETVASQYGNSPRLLALISALNEAIDPIANIDAFYNEVWNIASAKGYGLDVWGRIVGVSRIVAIENLQYFGFKQANLQGFGRARFYNGIDLTSNYALPDDAFRLLILAKAYSNISDGSIPAYNTALTTLFPRRGRAYVCDVGAMALRFVFEFFLKPYELTVVRQSSVIQAPTGVSTEIMVMPPKTVFGFNTPNHSYQTFGFGSFFRGFV